MIPQPPGSDSACRAGNGFQISNTRKSIKPRSKYFQLSPERIEIKPIGVTVQESVALFHQIGIPHPSSKARCCPETSSITTYWGSFSRKRFETRSEAQTPTAATRSERTICTKRKGSAYQADVFKKTLLLPRSIAMWAAARPKKIHDGSNARMT